MQGGDNRVACEKCNTTSEFERRSLIASAPEHLIISALRMSYETGTTVKSLLDVKLDPIIALPSVPQELVGAVYEEGEGVAGYDEECVPRDD